MNEDDEQREYRTEAMQLSSLTKQQALRIMSDALELGAQQLVLQDGTLTVGRLVLPNERVIPKPTTGGFDFPMLLSRLKLVDMPWTPGRKLLHVVHDALELPAINGGHARWVVCADRTLPFLALGLPPTTPTFFGLEVVEAEIEDVYKVFFVRSPTASIEQATMAVVVDIGR